MSDLMGMINMGQRRMPAFYNDLHYFFIIQALFPFKVVSGENRAK